jgi:ABC-2 type transport system ATP-binding protein
MAVMIKTVNLTKRYGTLVALSNLNLEINEGDCFGFIGPNGAGKTTTIKILATLLQPTWGEARVCDYVVGYQSRQIRPLIGYVPDYFGAYEDMVVQEYMEFFAAAYNINGTARTKIVNDVLELTDLSYKKDAPVDGLSRGMKQRLCLAKTLVHDPPVLILDEPSSGLDPRARLEVKALLKELRTMGKTILISSHILTELADCCTSIGIIERGQLLLHGPIETVYRQIQRNRHVEVRFAGNAEAGVSLIRSDPKVRDVQMNTRSCTLELEGGDADVQRLLRQLVAANCGLIGFHEKEPTLEDVFMMVTKGLVT